MTIGEKIKALRNRRGMTQKELGQACGIITASIRKYELGLRNPKPEQLKRIADGLQVSYSIFYDFEITRESDIAAFLFLLDNSVETELIKDNNEILIKFDNEPIQKFLREWYEVKEKTAEIIAEINNVKTEESKIAIQGRAKDYYNDFKVRTAVSLKDLIK